MMRFEDIINHISEVFKRVLKDTGEVLPKIYVSEKRIPRTAFIEMIKKEKINHEVEFEKGYCIDMVWIENERCWMVVPQWRNGFEMINDTVGIALEYEEPVLEKEYYD